MLNKPCSFEDFVNLTVGSGSPALYEEYREAFYVDYGVNSQGMYQSIGFRLKMADGGEYAEALFEAVVIGFGAAQVYAGNPKSQQQLATMGYASMLATQWQDDVFVEVYRVPLRGDIV